MKRLWLMLLFCSCLPDPRSVREHREGFDRDPLYGTVIVDRAPPLTEIGAVFDGKIELIGYSITPQRPGPGDRVELTFYWRALRPIPEDYWIFIHGDAPSGGARRIHGDHLPAGGEYPTDVWRPGEVVIDRFEVDIPKQYGPDRVDFFTGLYRGEYRVPLTNPGRATADRENRSKVVTLTWRAGQP